ncbi:PEP-CTERM sorting domain-containing protein [Massilia glaciei]|uniref:Ice-binding protein C-terminal domain-containing protein n=1 Tax=Massilia glaciei TaxID=1524097 RepID=A0A2U2I6E2_9BURK|nr:PEP-CTERM sorting domain-containing protein [Massilia glaciei]PWF55323.1 hypothetical protein C7C56_002350 [Massilia glaciei]
MNILASTTALAAALALGAGIAHAAVTEVSVASAHKPSIAGAYATRPAQNPSVPPAFIHHDFSTVPEPQVFAMMLLGLCLIGFRASRITDEKFK